MSLYDLGEYSWSSSMSERHYCCAIWELSTDGSPTFRPVGFFDCIWKVRGISGGKCGVLQIESNRLDFSQVSGLLQVSIDSRVIGEVEIVKKRSLFSTPIVAIRDATRSEIGVCFSRRQSGFKWAEFLEVRNEQPILLSRSESLERYVRVTTWPDWISNDYRLRSAVNPFVFKVLKWMSGIDGGTYRPQDLFRKVPSSESRPLFDRNPCPAQHSSELLWLYLSGALFYRMFIDF